MNNKKTTTKTRQELIDNYQELKKEKNSWWNILAHENNSIKTIFGGFILYIGYLIVAGININALLLIYCLIVIGVIWYWVDMLRTQYEKHRKEYQKQLRILNNDIRRFNKKKIVAEFNSLEIIEKRQFHLAQTLLPYIWGYAPESIHQEDLYQYKDINISTIQIKQEKASIDYWFLSTNLEQKFGEESTLVLPKPYRHDKWKSVAFNEQITSSEFKKNFTIFSSEFMHSYYLVSKEKIEQFCNLPSADKWMVFRKNNSYVLLPKKHVEVDILQLEKSESAAKEEAEEAIILGEQFWKIVHS